MAFSLGPQIAILFMLVFARVGSLVMLMPGFGERFLPGRIRLSLAVFLTLALMPIVRPLLPETAVNPAFALNVLLIEIAIGLMIGLTFRLVMASLQTAGNFIAQALGLAFAETVDPSQGGQSAALGAFLNLLAVTLIFATDAHHAVIGAIGGSYTALPPGDMPSTSDAVQLALQTLSKGFGVAIQIAAPFLVFSIVFNIGLGVLSRLMPAMQVFFLAMPAMIMLGFAVLIGVLGLMMQNFLTELSDLLVPYLVR